MQLIGGTLGNFGGTAPCVRDYVSHFTRADSNAPLNVCGFQQSMAAGDRVFGVMDTPSGGESGEKETLHIRRDVSIKDVSFSIPGYRC